MLGFRFGSTELAKHESVAFLEQQLGASEGQLLAAFLEQQLGASAGQLLAAFLEQQLGSFVEQQTLFFLGCKFVCVADFFDWINASMGGWMLLSAAQRIFSCKVKQQQSPAQHSS